MNIPDDILKINILSGDKDMSVVKELQASYIVDEKGNRKSVILPIDVYDNLLEDLNDLAIAAERQDENTISHKKVIKDLKKNGYIQD